jgi:hypothetical protein
VRGRHPHIIGNAAYAWFGQIPLGGRAVATFSTMMEIEVFSMHGYHKFARPVAWL